MSTTVQADGEHGNGFFQVPSTTIGWWAFGMALGGVILFLVGAMVPYWLTMAGVISTSNPMVGIGGLIGLAVAIAAAVAGLVAIIARRDNTFLVWFALLPGTLALVMLVGELLLPH